MLTMDELDMSALVRPWEEHFSLRIVHCDRSSQKMMYVKRPGKVSVEKLIDANWVCEKSFAKPK